MSSGDTPSLADRAAPVGTVHKHYLGDWTEPGIGGKLLGAVAHGYGKPGPGSCTSCHVEHVGMVISGCATAAMDDGRIIEMKAGDIFYVPPGHDSWVVGDEPYVSLHFLGADDYAAAKDAT